MAGNLQPLDEKFAIVDDQGRPTLYFIKWAQQRQIDITAGITEEQWYELIEQYTLDHMLQEGSGIQITPDGNLANSPTIAADAQEILDQIATAQGTILYRNASDWVGLAPGAAGKVLQTNGAGADPSWVTPSGGGGSGYTPPVVADFPTLLSIGAESFLADTIDGLAFSVGVGGAGTVVRCILKALPAVPYTITFKIDAIAEGITGDGLGLILRDSASGRLIKFGMEFNAGPSQVIVERWTTNTNFSAASKTATIPGSMFPWLRVTDNNVNLVYEWALSKNGPWMPFFSEARTAWLAAANQVGFGIEDQNDNTYMMLVRSYA